MILSFLLPCVVKGAIVQYARGKLCLGSKDGPASERGALSLISCNSSILSFFDDSPDPLGNPQIAAADTMLCVNDDDVKCVEGNDIFYHACQGGI